MKKLIISFLFVSAIAQASSFNSSFELVYIYGTFIGVILLIVGIDRAIKYIYKKLKERNEVFNEPSEFNHFDE
jgi:H+/gluconate symporter-like permease